MRFLEYAFRLNCVSRGVTAWNCEFVLALLKNADVYLGQDVWMQTVGSWYSFEQAVKPGTIDVKVCFLGLTPTWFHRLLSCSWPIYFWQSELFQVTSRFEVFWSRLFTRIMAVYSGVGKTKSRKQHAAAVYETNAVLLSSQVRHTHKLWVIWARSKQNYFVLYTPLPPRPPVFVRKRQCIYIIYVFEFRFQNLRIKSFPSNTQTRNQSGGWVASESQRLRGFPP